MMGNFRGGDLYEGGVIRLVVFFVMLLSDGGAVVLIEFW